MTECVQRMTNDLDLVSCAWNTGTIGQSNGLFDLRIGTFCYILSVMENHLRQIFTHLDLPTRLLQRLSS